MPKTSKTKRCPLCGKPESPAHTPFCGPGCKDRDLLKWLGDGYRIPGPPVEEHDLPGRVDSGDSEG